MEQSKKGEVFYRKVSVKERLPQKEGKYFIGWDLERTGKPVIRMTAQFTGKVFIDTENDWELSEPTYWLEETNLTSLIESRMPTEEEIQKYGLEKYPVHMDISGSVWDDGNKDLRKGYEEGQRDLINKLLNSK